ncbi:peptide-methionine (S)-S-oxide reductase MsrA [Leptolyngbya sp. CCNP1308]|uniref:peptide-methionine (S)-S-oxide reductase MsrA n=1 Tax=Leptolyngbya sp. CCNP1308 TaxID=3110255 RepID=UPI002B20F915|nr:peptide-methionine (S)-S-oxide reductase MsrA [Leptolyngbya sp. CCNP1308]MEA5450177.1 peptide-methionine (S)-S-oxide reductase MsrA [Leptolyngbya sp. CCNP1308]
MQIVRRLLLGLLLLATLGLIWDALPFYATADSMPEATAVDDPNLATATFAGGCFWCMEGPFDKLDGVISTTSGYTGGTKVDPTYYEVSAGGTGHVEAVQVVYDPTKVSYETLLQVFWKNVDPLDNRGQFCDKGSQYQAKIFAHGDDQQVLAEQSKQALSRQAKFQKTPIVTAIEPAQTFYPAEDYHQDYYLKHPLRYKYYRTACGRDQRLAEVWGSGE